MNKLIILIFGIIIVTIISAYLINDTQRKQIPVSESGFTYHDIKTIQSTLAQHDIVVSAPTVITDDTIDQYCLYFDNNLQRSVSYCTTTAVISSTGVALGNINLGGDENSPILAIVNLETSTLESHQAKVFTIFENVIESLVCDCWGEQSKEFATPTIWFEAVQNFYLDSGKQNIKSKIDNLENTRIFLEITSKEDSILRTLVILK